MICPIWSEGQTLDIKDVREGDIVKRVGTSKVETVKEFKRLIDESRENGLLLLLIKKQAV